MIRLAVFLGNPGAEHAYNRHNAGRLLVERFPPARDFSWQKKFKGRFTRTDFFIRGGEPPSFRPPRCPVDRSRGQPPPAGSSTAPPAAPPSAPGASSPAPPRDHCLLLPETYMNRSGESVLAAASFYKIPPAEILAVHDELELPLGFLSLKSGGGLGGHNGLRSMKDALGTGEFWRLRIGVGRPPGRLPGEGGRPVKGGGEGGSGEVARWVLSDFSAAETPVLETALLAAGALLFRLFVEEPEGLLPEWKKKNVGEV